MRVGISHTVWGVSLLSFLEVLPDACSKELVRSAQEQAQKQLR